MKRVLVLAILLTYLPLAHTNPGEDGTVTITTAGNVINAYGTLNAATASGAISFTLVAGGTGALALPASSGVVAGNRPIAAGDLLMLYQAQGATIDTSTTANTYGNITAYNSAGRYEFVYVASIAGETITIVRPTSGACAPGGTPGGLRYAYSAGAMAVRVPQYANLTINAGASVVASAWNGTIGGLVVADIRGTGSSTLTLNGSINVSGLGFRGGALDNNTNYGIVSFATTQSADGAEKGESIAGSQVTYDGLNGRYGRGAPANGGGGGNAHNAGGGGGANGGVVANWTNGRGVPNRTTNTAWALEDNDTGQALRVAMAVGDAGSDSGGGRGGYSYGSNNLDALTIAPFNTGWGGDNRAEVGGRGGRPLNTANGGGHRLFFGGGGGAGDANNTAGGAGANGGGAVFIITKSVAGSGSIIANGNTAANSSGGNNDAPGGGGGGGSIYLSVAASGAVPSTMTITANGGNGGNQLITSNESEGPGGGGGGGVIGVSAGSPMRNATGGGNGTTSSSAVAEFTQNGGTSGGVGTTAAAIPSHTSEVFQCVQGTGLSTPVTTAYFSSLRSNGRLLINFTTATESGNVGFRLYDADNMLLTSLIASRTVDSDSPQTYSIEIADLGQQQLWLADVDLKGTETRHGPFNVGSIVGAPMQSERINWLAIRTEQRQIRSGASIQQTDTALITTADPGMYKLTGQDLLNAGVNLIGLPAATIAVTDINGPVGRLIEGLSKGDALQASSSIVFYAPKRSTLYSDLNGFYITKNARLALPMQQIANEISGAAIPAIEVANEVFAPQRKYSFSAPVADPWFADNLFANGQSLSRSYILSLDRAVPGSQAWLSAAMWGAIDHPNTAGADHHALIAINGTTVANLRADGLAPMNALVAFVAQAQTADVRISLPADTGYSFDMINLDSLSVRYLRPAQPSNTRFFGALQAPEISAAKIGALSIAGFDNATKLRGFRIQDDTAAAFALSTETVSRTVTAIFDASINAGAQSIWVSNDSAFMKPSVSGLSAPAISMAGGSADLVVIAHSSFNNGANELAALRRSQGLSVQVIDPESIYRSYGNGVADAAAIGAFVRDAQQNWRTRYVLIIGGDTYDYKDYLSAGSMSFVPTLYAQTSEYVRFAASDELYADTDNDGKPDLAIGRLPVRTEAELTEALRKIRVFEGNPFNRKVAILVGPGDSQAEFSGIAADWSQSLAPSYDGQLIESDTLGVIAARAAAIAQANAGLRVLSYVGHSAPTRWAAQSLFNASDVSLLTNAQQPFLLLQWGCWNSYFVSPAANTMAHAFLLSPNKGAAAVFGATGLTEVSSHEALSKALGASLQQSTRLGDALLSAKRTLPATLRDVLIGTELLGDPSMLIQARAR